MNSKLNGDLSELADAFQGVTVTITTPFLPNSLDVDFEGMRKNVQAIAGSGLSVIVPSGNTGEYHSLTNEEVQAIAKLTIQEVESRAAVVIGIGGDLRTTIALAQFAQEAGAAGVLLHEPGHTFASEEGIYRYYIDLCRSVDIGVAIYKRTSRLSDDLIIRVARECTNVVAIKYAWNDVASYIRLTSEAPHWVTCACGSAERWALPFSIARTTGFTSGIANFAPELPLQYWRALQDDAEQALSMWHQLCRIEDLRASIGSAVNVPVVKHAMGLVGRAAGPLRPPLAPVSDEMAASIRSILDEWDLTLNEEL